MLQYDESGELYMFHAILPEREQQDQQLLVHALNQYLSHVRVLNFNLGDDYVELDDIFASGTSECFFSKLVLVVIRQRE